MIITVTLNAAWDRTYFVSGLRLGAAHAVAAVRGCPGGKGINVARVINALGGRALAAGLAGGPTGRAIEDGLAAEGIESSFSPTAADSRATLTIVDRTAGGVTEFREPGGPVTIEEFAAFLRHFGSLVQGASFCVLSGSVPPGLPVDAYARIIEVARRQGVRAVLDTGGPALAAGVSARPFMIKLNAQEAGALAQGLRIAGGRLEDGAEAVPAAARLAASFASAAEIVVLTLGQAGAVAGRAGNLRHAWVQLDEVCNPVGSGDALAAGMTVAMERGDGEEAALAFGVACGAANALTETAGRVEPADITRLLPRVVVRPMA